MSYCLVIFLTFGAFLCVTAVSAFLFYHREKIGRATNDALNWVANVFRSAKKAQLPRIPNLVPRVAIVSSIVIVFGVYMLNGTYQPCDKNKANQSTAETIGRKLLETTGIDCGCDS